jgi:N utilization substance protein B
VNKNPSLNNRPHPHPRCHGYTPGVISRKSEIRRLALQLLFLFDARNEIDASTADQAARGGSDNAEIRNEAIMMATGAWNDRESTDAWIERLAPQWPPRRQPGVDRNIIRLAVWELTHADTPPKVVLDEAIELAKDFSTENSPAFVNGVLDAVLRERNALREPPQEQNDQCPNQNDQSNPNAQ